jgi:hypothetical protein
MLVSVYALVLALVLALVVAAQCLVCSTAVPAWARLAFSVWTEFTVTTGKVSEHPRGIPLVTRMQELQASKRGIQWHHQEYIAVEKRVSCRR